MTLGLDSPLCEEVAMAMKRLRPQIRNSKSEVRNKFECSKQGQIRNAGLSNFAHGCVSNFEIGIWDLLRISTFELRILVFC